MSQNPHISLSYNKGIGPQRAKLLKSELGLETLMDLIHFFPNRYVDRSKLYKINQLFAVENEVQIVGKIVRVNEIRQKKGSRLVAIFEDETGQIDLVWFRSQKWIKANLKLQETCVVFGKISQFGATLNIVHPEIESYEKFKNSIQTGIKGIYPSTEKISKGGLSNRKISNLIEQSLQQTQNSLEENLPLYLINQLKLLPRKTALLQIHFPDNLQTLKEARYRLKFEEFFYLQLQLILKNKQSKLKNKGFAFKVIGNYFNTFYSKHLPFQLTKAQKKVIKEIRNDLGSNAQMNRLLQGDVGSGKTIVAFMSCLIAKDNDFQSCIMAPTEILAQQHFQGISDYAYDLGLQIELLTGSTKQKKRKQIHESLLNGNISILIGTHTLLEDKVQFQNLGLAVIDEQHRFGVAQRSKLWHKNNRPPHQLVMTATPIPRTLALTAYGDLDMSIIDELPVGRKPIKTLHKFDGNRLQVFGFIKEQINLGRQVYVVYPLIQESAVMDYKDLMDGYESILRSFPQPQYQVSIVHGKMKPEDKAYEMERFVKKQTQIMVATTVIEVGVNVPNATVMVIESAERFGLSQLHQLRGRVGRGSDQSYCILMTGFKLSSDAKTRLETMVETNDGFKIADVDLRLRGPGNILGTQQSGLVPLKIADLLKDKDILPVVRNVVLKIVNKDPSLELAEHKIVKNAYLKIANQNENWNNVL